MAAPVPTAVRARSTSDEVSFSWAPTSEETVSSDCCAARAPVWMVSLVLTTRLVSERSASSTWDLIAGGQLLGAGHQAVAGLTSAAFDAAGHGFDARTQQILELRDAHVDIGGDRADPGLDALVDFLEPRRDGVGQLGAAAVDGFGHAGDALVDRLDRLRGADVSDVVRWVRRKSIDSIACAVPSVSDVVSCVRRESIDSIACAAPDVSDVVSWVRRESIDWIACTVPSVSEKVSWVRRESIEWIACAAPSVSDVASVPRRLSMVSVTDFARVSKVCSSDLRRPSTDSSNDLILLSSELSRLGDAVAERGLELQQALVERGGDLAAVRGQAGVEVVDIGLQALGDVLGALAHAFDDLAAEGFDGAVEFRDVAGDQRAERAAVAGEFFGKLAALVLHQFVERAHLQAERVVRGSRSG